MIDHSGGWIEVALSDIAEISTGNTPSKKEAGNYGSFLLFVKPPELKDGNIISASESLSEKGAEKSRILPKDSVLVSCIGNLGKTGLSIETIAFNQQINGLIPYKNVNSRFLFYQAQSHAFNQQLEKKASATTIKIVNKQNFSTIKIRLAPFNEQTRIVEKIEELFSELDKGVESLKTAQQQLKVYRQALLKQAFEGKLTEQWRADNPDKVESAEQLLERIKAEWEARHQQQLEEWKLAVKAWEAAGEEDKKPAKPRKSKELLPLTEEELGKLPELPEGWCWIRNGYLLTIPASNGRSVKDRVGGFPVLRLTALKGEAVDLNESKEGAWDIHDALPYVVKSNDFLVARGNGSLKLVGKGGLVQESKNVAYPDTMIRLRVDKQFYNPYLFSTLWNSAFFRDQIEKSARTTAGIYKINQDHINGYLVPVAPKQEQDVLNDILAQQLSIIEQLEVNVQTNLKKSEALRQNILKKAFSGKLVSQNPDDESASELLARIRQEREAAELAAKEARKAAPKRTRKNKASAA